MLLTRSYRLAKEVLNNNYLDDYITIIATCALKDKFQDAKTANQKVPGMLWSEP